MAEFERHLAVCQASVDYPAAERILGDTDGTEFPVELSITRSSDSDGRSKWREAARRPSL